MSDEIEYWIHKGMLKDFLLAKQPSTSLEPQNQTKDVRIYVVNKVHMIFYGPSDRDVNYAKRAHVRGIVTKQEVLNLLHRFKEREMISKLWRRLGLFKKGS